MARAESSQFNIRSAFARTKARELAKETGLTVTQIVEDALRGYAPPGAPAEVGRLVRRGRILVGPSGGRRVTLAEANAVLKAVRERTP
ncbi:MAG: hypothetical protein ACR2F8_08070 [Caulobacteraceae bacterium]